MNKLEALLKNPEFAQPSDLEWIDQKIKEYPYVSAFRLFRLIALKKENQAAFENELPKVSFYFNDPEFVSNYFSESPVENEFQENQPISAATQDIENKSEEVQLENKPKEENLAENLVVKELENADRIETKIPDLDESGQLEISMNEPVENNVAANESPINGEESELIKNLRKLGLDHLIPDMQATRSDASIDSLHLDKSDSKNEANVDGDRKLEESTEEKEPISEKPENPIADEDKEDIIPLEEMEVNDNIENELVSLEAEEEIKKWTEAITPKEETIQTEAESNEDSPVESENKNSEFSDFTKKIETDLQETEGAIKQVAEELENEQELRLEEEKVQESLEPVNHISQEISEEAMEIEEELVDINSDELKAEKIANEEDDLLEEELAIEPIEFRIEDELQDLNPIPAEQEKNEVQKTKPKKSETPDLKIAKDAQGTISEFVPEEEKVSGVNKLKKHSKTGAPVLDKKTLSDKHTFSEWLKLYQQPSIQLTKDAQKSKKEAIETFLEKNPKITPVRSEEKDSVIDINSIMDNDQQISHLMTETLAKLYVEQRKFNKAIEAYEILILKNPEKSGIFADQIEKIKNLK